MSTQADARVRAAAIELSAAVVLLERIATIAEDWASPGYRADAAEREQLRQDLERLTVWRSQHAQLLAWAKRTGNRPAARVLGIIP